MLGVESKGAKGRRGETGEVSGSSGRKGRFQTPLLSYIFAEESKSCVSLDADS